MSDSITLKPNAEQTQFQILALASQLTQGARKFTLPAWSSLVSVVLEGRTVTVIYARQNVTERARSFVNRGTKLHAITYTYQPEDGTWPETSHIEVKQEDSAWRHLKFNDFGTPYDDGSLDHEIELQVWDTDKIVKAARR